MVLIFITLTCFGTSRYLPNVKVMTSAYLESQPYMFISDTEKEIIPCGNLF